MEDQLKKNVEREIDAALDEVNKETVGEVDTNLIVDKMTTAVDRSLQKNFGCTAAITIEVKDGQGKQTLAAHVTIPQVGTVRRSITRGSVTFADILEEA